MLIVPVDYFHVFKKSSELDVSISAKIISSLKTFKDLATSSLKLKNLIKINVCNIGLNAKLHCHG